MLYVRKKDGRIEPFTRSKIISTCIRAGGTYDVCCTITKEIERKFGGIIDSGYLLSYVRNRLKELGLYEAYIRYPLKEALYSLEGKEFEWYVARLLALEGYRVTKKDSLTIQGKCIEHEIDVLAERDRTTYIVECKHHMDLQILTDLTAVMKHYARFLDIKHRFRKPVPMVITNTKFTPHAIRYSRCVGMILIGWNVPYSRGINAIIEKHKAYPLTLFNIEKYYRDLLRDHKIYTTLDLYYRWNEAVNILPRRITNKVKKYFKILYNASNY